MNDPYTTQTIRLWPDCARLLGVSRYAIYEAARRGDVPTIRIGKLIRVPTAALQSLLGGATIANPRIEP